MKIIWSPLAIDRVSEIADYIAKDKPYAAKNWITNIFLKVKSLDLSPEMGRVVPEVNNIQFREIILGKYRVIYRLENNQISILTVRHGMQLLPLDEILA